MAYFLASIISITTALVILLTRYTADDSSINGEIEQMKTMISIVDGYVNTYIEAGESLETITAKTLDDNGILLSNSVVIEDSGGDNNKSTLSFPNNHVTFQIISNKDDSSSYELLINMTGNSALMSKARFSESFVGREYCGKMLFGEFQTTYNAYNETDEDFVSNSGTNSDGVFACIVYK